MNWFKTKKTVTSSDPTGHLYEIVRTMEDDLSGRGVSIAEEKSSEPLVSFRPDRVIGAPFFAAPGVVVTEESAPPTTEDSPFLREVPEPVTIDDKETPTFDPPLFVPKKPLTESVVTPTVTNVPGHEAASVAFNTAHATALPSFRESLSSLRHLTQGFKPLFQDRKLRFVTLIAALLLFFVVVGGAYLGWKAFVGKNLKLPNVSVESPMVDTKKGQSLSISQTKYLAEQPNIMSFDIETVTAPEIKKAFLQAAQAIRKDNISGPVEFLIRDQKLNPLAFSRFAYLLKLNLPGELLSTLDEPFSIYITIEGEHVRLALLTYVKDQPAFDAELRRNESKLAQFIEPLFLDVTTAPKNNLVFRDSSYLERPVRYANVDAELGLSVDYAVRGRQWVLGTSKASLRSVLDKTGL